MENKGSNIKSPTRSAGYKAYAELGTNSEYSDYDQDLSSSSSGGNLKALQDETDKQSEYHDEVMMEVVDLDSTLDRISVDDSGISPGGGRAKNNGGPLGIGGGGTKASNEQEFEFSYNPILKS